MSYFLVYVINLGDAGPDVKPVENHWSNMFEQLVQSFKASVSN